MNNKKESSHTEIVQYSQKKSSLKNVFLSGLSMIVLLNGLLGMIGIAIIFIQLPQVFATLDNTNYQLNQIATGIPNDFSKNFKDMANNLRSTANSLNNICAASFIGVCLYKVNLSDPATNLRAVANNIENIPNTLQIERLVSSIRPVVDSVQTIKPGIVALLGYLFIQHFSFFAIGVYMLFRGK